MSEKASKSLRIRMAQLNYKIADFAANADKIVRAIEAGRDADLLVFSELALSGYAPLDLVQEPWFLEKQDEAMGRVLAASMHSDSLIAIGLVTRRQGAGKKLANSMSLVFRGQIVQTYDKQLLPTYDVFDERRYFEPGDNQAAVYPVKGIRVGFMVCEDGWNDQGEAYAQNPVEQAVGQGAEVIVSLNASPSNLGKRGTRRRMFDAIAAKYQVPVVYVNQVGGNDQVVYDGASFVATASGGYYEAPLFEESLAYAVIEDGEVVRSTLGAFREIPDPEFQFRQILLGLQDYLKKTGFTQVVVGSSGGIDSAVTLALAAEALGSGNVAAVTMPSAYSSEGSVSDSQLLCDNLDVLLFTHPIAEMVETECRTYERAFGMRPSGLALENLQARIRGMVLMTWSNQTGSMLLTTGNKSELSVGYATLYGDMAGGLNLIGDLYKTEVYALAEYINARAGKELIPRAIIEKAPSAELAPGQKDEDSLPPYPMLDAQLKLLIERNVLPEEDRVSAEAELARLPGENRRALHTRIGQMLARAEFKRRQAPPVIRCRALAFGSGRQMPIAAKWG